MRILGISAHYHDSAAALSDRRRPGRRRSRKSGSRGGRTTRPFRWRRSSGASTRPGSSPSDLDAVVFYEKPMLKFERILTTALRAFPRSWRSFPQAMREHARREALGQGHHRVPPRRPGRQDPLHRASPGARRGRVPHAADRSARRSSPPTASASGRRSPSAAASARRRRDADRASARGPLPAFARACSTRPSPRSSASRSTRANTRSWGSPRTARPRFVDEVRQLDPAHRRRRVCARCSTTSISTRRPKRSLLADDSSSSSGRRAIRYEPLDPTTPRGQALRRHRGQRAEGARGHAGRHRPRAPRGDRACRSLPRRRRRAQRLRQRAHPAASRASSGSSCRRRRATPVARSARRSTPTASTSGSPIDGVPDHPFWGPRVGRRRAERGSRPRTACRSRRCRTMSDALRSRRRGARRPARSSAGWTAPPSSARARSAIAASWPRRTRRRCGTG